MAAAASLPIPGQSPPDPRPILTKTAAPPETARGPDADTDRHAAKRPSRSVVGASLQGSPSFPAGDSGVVRRRGLSTRGDRPEAGECPSRGVVSRSRPCRLGRCGAGDRPGDRGRAVAAPGADDPRGGVGVAPRDAIECQSWHHPRHRTAGERARCGGWPTVPPRRRRRGPCPADAARCRRHLGSDHACGPGGDGAARPLGSGGAGTGRSPCGDGRGSTPRPDRPAVDRRLGAARGGIGRRSPHAIRRGPAARGGNRARLPVATGP